MSRLHSVCFILGLSDFPLLFEVLYVIAVFATITIGQSEAIQNSTDETLFDLFRSFTNDGYRRLMAMIAS